jgi:hypothetical protein
MGVPRAKERIDAALEGWSGSQPSHTALEARNIAWGDEKSATCTVTAWWIFPFRRRFGMSWWQLVAPNHTTFSLRAAG